MYCRATQPCTSVCYTADLFARPAQLLAHQLLAPPPPLQLALVPPRPPASSANPETETHHYYRHPAIVIGTQPLLQRPSHYYRHPAPLQALSQHIQPVQTEQLYVSTWTVCSSKWNCLPLRSIFFATVAPSPSSLLMSSFSMPSSLQCTPQPPPKKWAAPHCSS